ncbi:hypothetical protein K469DRAFT_260533 [Zopfia rhizophila CBS 207.26]|uniref:Uncharacterized protein n=1 Tax=Zopfia rhizophila CBS 207.26 TaxID=1314779 RepID=A0A6A6DPT6_9PEZI|nr:hypothetical protein K469DRAFT_260533 [Zopfia rhizophila CBS 207.26]
MWLLILLLLLYGVQLILNRAALERKQRWLVWWRRLRDGGTGLNQGAWIFGSGSEDTTGPVLGNCMRLEGVRASEEVVGGFPSSCGGAGGLVLVLDARQWRDGVGYPTTKLIATGMVRLLIYRPGWLGNASRLPMDLLDVAKATRYGRWTRLHTAFQSH